MATLARRTETSQSIQLLPYHESTDLLMEEAPEKRASNRRRPTPEFSWEDVATASLPVLACFLGGATEKWAEGIVVAVLGFLLLLNPPRFSLGPVLHGILLALIALAAVAFLPARWFFEPLWRQAMHGDFGVSLPETLSAQPWISASGLISFLAALCWLYYVAGGDVEVRAARRQLRIFALGVILLAACAIALYLTHSTLPFWHNQRGFGPFPNRNHTANFLGISAGLIIACAHDEIRHGRKRWIAWLLGLAIVIVAIVLNFSRAGVALLLFSSAAWLAVLVIRRGSLARTAVGLSALLVLVGALLLFGGETLERFQLHGAAGATISRDFRWLIFHDTFQLIRASPWCGVGLGNFSPVFAIFRDVSLGQNRAMHPESDWLWVWAELGWPAVALVLLGAAVLVRRAFPFVEGTNQWFRVAALIAAVLFALHGLADVSGHHVGTAYAGLFLVGMAVKRPLRAVASVGLTNSFRGFGLILIAVGLTWVVAIYREIPLPGSIGADVERRLGTRANVGRNHAETIERTTRALTWAPLDWQLYFLRALGKVGAKRPNSDALDDFRRARFLEPASFEVPYQEGLAWITRNQLLALTAWREALRRAGPERPELYARMLSSASAVNPGLNHALEEFGASMPDLALVYLARATGATFTSALNQLLQNDSALPRLTEAQREQLFALWTERGDLAQLSAYAEAHPELLPLAWRGVARQRANQRDFEGAFELVRRYAPRPSLPKNLKAASTEDLQKSLLANPNDYETGFALYDLQMREQKVDDALITARRLAGQAGAPAYWHYLEAEAWAAKGNSERAWQAWQAYEVAIPRTQ
ncbi:MAG: O-antigen ligase family protein [Verrucomicrobiota bacterium]|nr:O-antigen ligase family protein [Verrucomicrobiota bacterium]